MPQLSVPERSKSLLRFLLILCAAAATPGGQPQTPSPARDVLVQFCDLDAQGAQLTPAGWNRIAVLFAAPGVPQVDEITVVRNFVVSRAEVRGNRAAEFYVEYVQLGRVDARARFLPLPARKVRAAFEVVVPEQAAGWRIAGRVPAPHLTVDAAVRYTTGLQTGAPTEVVRKNAASSIGVLRKLR